VLDPVLLSFLTTTGLLHDCSNGTGIEEMQRQKGREMQKQKKRPGM
jgi:hypothetical protein